jgi:hypothetical protein
MTAMNTMRIFVFCAKSSVPTSRRKSADMLRVCRSALEIILEIEVNPLAEHWWKDE